MTYIGHNDYVCEDCLHANYTYCDECEEYHHNDYINRAINQHGNDIYVCDSCIDNFYILCEDCHSIYVHEDNAVHVHRNGEEIQVCPNCADDYKECTCCGEYYHKSELNEDGLCPDCATERESDDE